MALVRTLPGSVSADTLSPVETKLAIDDLKSPAEPRSAHVHTRRPRGIDETNKPRLDGPWLEFGDLDVHVGFALLGLFLIKLKTIENDEIKLVTPTDNTFILGSRKLAFFKPKIKLNKKDESKEIDLEADVIHDHTHMGLDDREHVFILNKLNELEANNHKIKQVSAAMKDVTDFPFETIKLILQYCELDSLIIPKSDTQVRSIRLQRAENQIVHNAERRSEIFYPFVLNLDGEPEKAQRAYVYPWLSKDLKKAGKDLKFDGCKRFISCECMFATNLKGIDERDQSFPLIKHDIILKPGQSIEEIEYLSEFNVPNIYETQRFENEFKKELELILKYSKWDSRPELAKHLPIHDYVLFGVQLYIRGKITLKALNELFKVIFKKGREIAQKMTERCLENGIDIIVGSPFQNLFKPIEDAIENELSNGESGQLAHVILNELGVPLPSDGRILEEALTENEFVQNWLAKIQRVGEQEHSEVWRDVLQVPIQVNGNDAASKSGESKQFKDTITDIDTLFKVGNGVWTLMRSSGTKDFETMIMVPLTEKPIQLMAEKLCKYPQLAKKYPATINLTVLDSLISHHFRNKGLSFYQYRHPVQHLALFNMWQHIAPRIERGELNSSKQVADAFCTEAESIHLAKPSSLSGVR